MVEKAGACGKHLVKRQASLLQSDGPEKSNIQVRAPPGDGSISAAIQRFNGIERAKLAPRVDGVVTVVRASASSRGLLIRLRDELRKLKAEHLGVVLNAVRAQGGGYYGRNIKTYYEYQNGHAH